MHIVFIVTRISDQKCGVVDYTRQLAQSLKEIVPTVTLEELDTWSFTELERLRKKYKTEKDVVFHLQYPTVGMGKSIAPALLNLWLANNKTFITFHEFEQFNLIRKFYFLTTSLTNTNYIFTNEHEKQQFLSFFPWTQKKCNIIPIGNNITRISNEENVNVKHRLVYFGQIAPNKGIESFLDLVMLLRELDINIPCAVIGGTFDTSNELLDNISDKAEKYNIECLYNLSSEDVSEQLHNSTVAYLPFPEGVSDKRGSALACLTHDLNVITIHSNLTPNWWTQSTYNAKTHEAAVSVIKKILSCDEDPEYKERSANVLEIALKERKWKHIADKHKSIYKGL